MELLLPDLINTPNSIKTTFTFQYGATSTNLYVNGYKGDYKFTFQYGATSTF